MLIIAGGEEKALMAARSLPFLVISLSSVPRARIEHFSPVPANPFFYRRSRFLSRDPRSTSVFAHLAIRLLFFPAPAKRPPFRLPPLAY